MPTYSFQCKNCNHKFSKLVSRKNKDGNELVCPQCNHEKLSRIFEGGAAVQTRSSSSSCEGGSCSVCPTCS